MINNLMEAINKPSQANDYAVAKDLNDKIYSLMISTVMIVGYELNQIGPEVTKLNRAYILLAAELQEVYERNPELSSISPEPIWKQFDMLKGNFDEISSVLVDDDSEDDSWIMHNDKLERLYILSGEEKPIFSTSQKRAIKEAEDASSAFKKLTDEARVKHEEEKKNHVIHSIITEYYLTYKPDGSIIINNALKLKKVHVGSITEKLLEQSIKNPNKQFKPNLGKTARNISTIISSAGFTPVLRDLFFPTVSGDTVVFRPDVSREQAIIEKIDTEELDSLLKENGAICRVVFEPK